MNTTRSLITLAAALLLVGSVGAVSAQNAESPHNAQQDKMKSCNVEAGAKNLTGDERKQFMKDCLSAASTHSSGLNRQQQKMKSCNAEAKSKSLVGEDRVRFMNTCLKGA